MVNLEKRAAIALDDLTGLRPRPPRFVSLSSEIIRFPLALSGAAQIADLLAMTPHLYRASAEGRAKAAALTALSVTVDVRLTRLGLSALSTDKPPLTMACR